MANEDEILPYVPIPGVHNEPISAIGFTLNENNIPGMTGKPIYGSPIPQLLKK